MLEVCCGSFEDALHAHIGGAHRIELNSALHLGGLTPTVACLRLVKKHTSFPVICMVRMRDAGFCYSDRQYEQMVEEAKVLLENGADGLAFGFLLADASIDEKRTKEFVTLVHRYNKEAVFHRAFDCSTNPQKSMETLLSLQVDRLLTSGMKNTAMEGKDCIKMLQQEYGDKIEILPGSGIRTTNAKELVAYTGVSQVHSSCKAWQEDPTTITHVSYSYHNGAHESDYDIVSVEEVSALVDTLCK